MWQSFQISIMDYVKVLDSYLGAGYGGQPS
jgi:hypothetical protein